MWPVHEGPEMRPLPTSQRYAPVWESQVPEQDQRDLREIQQLSAPPQLREGGSEEFSSEGWGVGPEEWVKSLPHSAPGCQVQEPSFLHKVGDHYSTHSTGLVAVCLSILISVESAFGVSFERLYRKRWRREGCVCV